MISPTGADCSAEIVADIFESQEMTASSSLLLTQSVGPAGKRRPASHTQVKMTQLEPSTLAAVCEAAPVCF